LAYHDELIDAAVSFYTTAHEEFAKTDRFPRENDVLFTAGPIHALNARLDSPANVSFNSRAYSFYSDGYLDGARILTLQACYGPLHRDTMIYPIVFLYRHHVELMLKRLLAKAHVLLNRPLGEIETKHLNKHRLDFLWKHFKPVLGEIIPEGKRRLAAYLNQLEDHSVIELGVSELNEDDLAGIDSYIAQLHEHDPESMTFRYAGTKGGTPSHGDVRLINIPTFVGTVERLVSYLDGCEKFFDMIEEYQDYDAAEASSE
jgi:hypothetical protein